MNYKASVIISVYDNPRFLNLVLDSLKLQTEQNFEIIISEDGENKAMKEASPRFPQGVRLTGLPRYSFQPRDHSWPKIGSGYQAGRIRN